MGAAKGCHVPLVLSLVDKVCNNRLAVGQSIYNYNCSIHSFLFVPKVLCSCFSFTFILIWEQLQWKVLPSSLGSTWGSPSCPKNTSSMDWGEDGANNPRFGFNLSTFWLCSSCADTSHLQNHGFTSGSQLRFSVLPKNTLNHRTHDCWRLYFHIHSHTSHIQRNTTHLNKDPYILTVSVSINQTIEQHI